MAHLTAKLILYRFNETLTNMADSILGFFYTDEARQSLDVINMLFVGWILLGILVYFLGTFIASQIERARRNESQELEDSIDNLSPSNETKNDQKSDLSVKPNQRRVAGAVTSGPGVEELPQEVEELLVASAVADLQGAPRVGPLSHVPLAKGPDPNSIRWINHILVWFYTTSKTPLLTDCLLHSLNDQTNKSSTEHGILVEFEKLILEGPQPEIREVFVSPESSNNVTVTCKVLAKQLLINLLATRNAGNERSSADYELFIEKLDAKMKITCNTEDRLLVARFIDRPDVRLTLKLASGALKSSSLDQRALEDTIVEIAIQALASSVVDLHFSQDPEFPKYIKQKSPITPTNYAGMVECPSSPARHERRLFVKIIKANNLGADRGCQEAYCVVEMDEPSQRFQTAGLKATNSPFWDEHFLFNISKLSTEILFEIYDRGKRTGENFLGLGIVSVEELLKNPSQRQIIALQSRPLENDKVTGALTVEFLFMEGSAIPMRPQAGRTVETNSRVTSGGNLVTTTTIKKTEQEEPVGPEGEGRRWSVDDDLTNEPQTFVSVPTLETYSSPNSVMTIERADVTSYRSVRGGTPTTQKKAVVKPTSKITSNGTKHSPNSEDSNHTQIEEASTFKDLFKDTLFDSPHKPSDDVFVPPNLDLESHPGINVVTLPSVLPSKNEERLNPNGLTLDVPREELPQSPPPVPVPQPNSLPSPASGDSTAPVLQLTPATPLTDDSSDIHSSVEPESPRSFDLPQLEELDGEEDDPHLKHDQNAEPLTKKVHGNNWLLSKLKGNKKKIKLSNDELEDRKSLTDTALKELENMGKLGKSANKSTLIIHSVQREVLRPTVKVTVDKEGRWREVTTAPQTNGENASGSASSPSSPVSKGVPSIANSESSTPSDSENRSARSKDRKTFMGTLRKRLSFKKNRSKSVDQKNLDAAATSGQTSNASSRSVSADRSKSVPGSRETSTGRHPGSGRLEIPGGGSTRSSISEGSGFSGTSTRTYINENSTLVVEMNENGITKHYLIPFSLASRSKWRKRGVKLHIYNDHTFVAKHISGSVDCQVCTRRFPRRPGKQAYACRDCDLQCHKACHVKVDSRCPNSTIHTLEMEYVQDTRTKKTS